MDRQHLLSVAKELRQVAISVSVVGTRRWKLEQLATKVRPIRDEMSWLRPDISKARSMLARAIHNMERAPENGRQAKNLRMAADAIGVLAKIMGRSIIPRVVTVHGHKVVNAWGYSSSDLMGVMGNLSSVSDVVGHAWSPGAMDVKFVVNPMMSRNAYAFYDASQDTIYINPDRSSKADVELIAAIGDRLWAFAGSEGRSAWGADKSGWSRFVSAWTKLILGHNIDQESMHKLSMTAGKAAPRQLPP